MLKDIDLKYKSGALTTTKNLTLSGSGSNLTVGGTLSLTGAASLAGNLTVAGSGTVTGALTVAGVSVNGVQAADHGFIAWNFDPIVAQNANNTNTQGTVFLNAIRLRTAQTISNLHCYVGTAGSVATSGQNFIGLIASNGTLMASAGMDTAFTSTGLKTMSITPQSVPAGWCWVAILSNMGTGAALLVGNANGATQNLSPNIGLSAANYRCAVNGTSATTLANITPGNNSLTGAKPFWVALT